MSAKIRVVTFTSCVDRHEGDYLSGPVAENES